LLGPDHMGFKNPICTQCHELPVSGHAANLPPQCARCHGANGACDPNGPNSPREHDSGDQCLACHGNRHGFENRNDCVACHFAKSGLDESCGSPPPERTVRASRLASNICLRPLFHPDLGGNSYFAFDRSASALSQVAAAFFESLNSRAFSNASRAFL